MSQIPRQVVKGVIGAGKQTAKVVSAPVKGGIMAGTRASNNGKSAGGITRAVGQGVLAGALHPNKVTKAANFGGVVARGNGVQAMRPVQGGNAQPGANLKPR